jgi:hypothetical protein
VGPLPVAIGTIVSFVVSRSVLADAPAADPEGK